MLWLIGAGLGMAMGAIGTYQQGKRDTAALEHNRDIAWQQYLYGKDYSDAQFMLKKNESLDHLTRQEHNLNTQLGLSMNDFNTALLGQAFSAQDARIHTNSVIGEALTAEGMSGTRNNSSSEMIRAYASQNLERGIDAQDRQSADYLNRLMSGANMTADAIDREKASWSPGGYRYQEKADHDRYNLNLANLGQKDFDWRIDQAQPGIFDYITGILGGATRGFGLGTSANDYFNKTGNPFKDVFKKRDYTTPPVPTSINKPGVHYMDFPG